MKMKKKKKNQNVQCYFELMLTIFTCFSLLNKGHRKFVQKLALSCNFSASLRKNQSKFWEHLFPQILCLHNTSI